MLWKTVMLGCHDLVTSLFPVLDKGIAKGWRSWESGDCVVFLGLARDDQDHCLGMKPGKAQHARFPDPLVWDAVSVHTLSPGFRFSPCGPAVVCHSPELPTAQGSVPA